MQNLASEPREVDPDPPSPSVSDELRRVRRLYAALSRVNRALVTATSQSELFEAVCAALVDGGPFVMAWVGWLEPSTQRIVPVARRGDDDGYLDAIQVFADDRPEGRGPTGSAVREGAPFLCNDLHGDDAMDPFRGAATTRGFRSSAAFPVRVGGEVRGALSVYAREPGYFREDEVALLGEAAGDLSFALDNLARVDAAAAADGVRAAAARKLDAKVHEVGVAHAQRERDHDELRMLERAIRCASQGIAIADARAPGHPVLYVSPAFERFAGATAPALLGAPFLTACRAERDAEVRQKLERALSVGERCGVEIVERGEAQAARFSRLEVSPVHDEGGVLTHFAAVQTDVTERRRLEADLRQAQKLEAVGRLAAGIAHDFNNILSIILGYSSLLLQQAEPGTTTYADLEGVQRASERAAELTRQLLAFSRRQVQKPRRLDVAQVVAGLDGLLRRVLGDANELVLVAARPSGTVFADPTQIEQVILNLVVNARDAMPQGGRVTIETGTRTLDEAAAADARVAPGRWVELVVRDTGVGIAPEVRERVFEPFFTTKEMGEGTGLGLSTVLGIVEQSGGRVRIESEVGQGTRVCILLPRLEGEIEDPTTPPLPRRRRRRDELVLLAEDDDAVRHVVRTTLERSGFRVITAASGEEALAAAEATAEPIHLLLTDVVMPGIHGRELAERLTLQRPDTRVLFMSGHTEDAVLHRARLAGGAAFLPKPFRVDELLAKIDEVFAASSPSSRPASD